MKMSIKINLDNAAFDIGEENAACGYEISRQLRKLAEILDNSNVRQNENFAVRDINGNKTLFAEVKTEDADGDGVINFSSYDLQSFDQLNKLTHIGNKLQSQIEIMSELNLEDSHSDKFHSLHDDKEFIDKKLGDLDVENNYFSTAPRALNEKYGFGKWPNKPDACQYYLVHAATSGFFPPINDD